MCQTTKGLFYEIVILNIAKTQNTFLSASYVRHRIRTRFGYEILPRLTMKSRIGTLIWTRSKFHLMLSRRFVIYLYLSVSIKRTLQSQLTSDYNHMHKRTKLSLSDITALIDLCLKFATSHGKIKWKLLKTLARSHDNGC